MSSTGSDGDGVCARVGYMQLVPAITCKNPTADNSYTRQAPALQLPRAPKHEKKVVYWEDKITGDYSRMSVTEKMESGGGGYKRYDTFTTGNKFTGESSTFQDREAYEAVGRISAGPRRTFGNRGRKGGSSSLDEYCQDW